MPSMSRRRARIIVEGDMPLKAVICGRPLLASAFLQQRTIWSAAVIVPHQQAGHMTAADQIVRCCKKALANRGRPHMTALSGISPSTIMRALRLDIDGIERLARRHEQPVSLLAAEAEVGAGLGQTNLADAVAVRCKD